MKFLKNLKTSLLAFFLHTDEVAEATAAIAVEPVTTPEPAVRWNPSMPPKYVTLEEKRAANIERSRQWRIKKAAEAGKEYKPRGSYNCGGRKYATIEEANAVHKQQMHDAYIKRTEGIRKRITKRNLGVSAARHNRKAYMKAYHEAAKATGTTPTTFTGSSRGYGYGS